MTTLLKQAVRELNINVPIYRTEEHDGTLTLYLYGGRIVRYPTSPPSPSPSDGEGNALPSARGEVLPPDDFTAIPYVGNATAKALHKAGFRTFQDLINADDTQLLDVPKVNPYVLAKIRSYLYIHYL